MEKPYGIDKAMSILRERSRANEMDYRFVMDCLKEYGCPRGKLGRLLQSEALIRIKKGLYVLGPAFKHAPYRLEILAGMIYGPSYVSLERALQIYGLIPEHAEAVTSITRKPGKEFRTPVGSFVYTHCHPESYSVGITSKSYSPYETYLIATPEKALTDMLTVKRGKVTSVEEMGEILLEDLRIEEEDLRSLDLGQVQKIRDAHPHSAVRFLEKWLSRAKGVSA